MEQLGRKTQFFKNATGQSRVADYTRNYSSHHANLRKTMNEFYQSNGFKKQLAQKLAYEWKNVYRTLSNCDPANLGITKIQQFQKACGKCAVELDRKDLVKLV